MALPFSFRIDFSEHRPQTAFTFGVTRWRTLTSPASALGRDNKGKAWVAPAAAVRRCKRRRKKNAAPTPAY